MAQTTPYAVPSGSQGVSERAMEMGEQALDLGTKGAEVMEIVDPDSTTADLILIGRTNAPPRGSERGIAPSFFARDVELDVIGKDEGTGFADFQTRARRDAHLLKQGDLFEQRLGRDNHAVTDKTLDIGAQYA